MKKYLIDFKKYPPKQLNPEELGTNLWYIQPNNCCLYFADYCPDADFHSDEIRSLILNFKKKKGENGYSYKERAIDTIAGLLNHYHKAGVDATFVPIPPSHAKSDKKYDDRLIRVLKRMGEIGGWSPDIRELIERTETETSAHLGGARVDPSKMSRKWRVVESLLYKPYLPKKIVIFDDIITTGSQYKEMGLRLRRAYGREIPISGLFIARTFHNYAADFEDESAILT